MLKVRPAYFFKRFRSSLTNSYLLKLAVPIIFPLGKISLSFLSLAQWINLLFARTKLVTT